jgi:hypothetical protein
VITYTDISASKKVEAGLRTRQSEMATHSVEQGLTLDRALERLRVQGAKAPPRKPGGAATRKAPGAKGETGR